MSIKHDGKTTKSERESLQVAEAAREKEWRAPSFLKEMFLGNFRLDLIHPFPATESDQDRPEFTEFYNKLKHFLETECDSEEIDRTGEYPEKVISGLARMGAFGMKIPKEYGGHGFTQAEYSRLMELLGSMDGNVCALLSAHQSIGLPQPLKVFGTEEQKKKYLPRCAAGAISAFALTEDGVGSDPARLATTAELTPDGESYVLNGRKLWCTNGTLAEVIVVMAVNPETRKISAFIVETSTPGVKIEHRCHFMGLRAIGNGVISFTDVRIPKENLIGKEGAGLKIALVTLNTGRLSLPAGVLGGAKQCLEICRRWAGERAQWGKEIGKHEAIAHKLAEMAAKTFAMEAISDLASSMADRGGYDIRLEAAAAKEYNSVEGWNLIDETMQIRGGRGYETEASLRARGDETFPVERMMRDSRINRIFEGSSEIMHLFMAREALDRHISISGKMIEPGVSMGQKLAMLPKIGAFYATWYPTRWLGWGRWPRYGEFGKLAGHLRFCERSSRKLARQIFHGMVFHGPKLQNKQAFLFRIVDVANELFAMAATVSRAQAMKKAGHAEAKHAAELADMFCMDSTRKVKKLFKDLWSNDDDKKYAVGRHVLSGNFNWLDEGTVDLDAACAPKRPVGVEREAGVAG
ncbi:acyl-CoA dehydrogenase [Acidobacteria bacterium Mor1]|nr:acyl-CoA dehydrogenase [Acidobacteria bacterium Mor1]